MDHRVSSGSPPPVGSMQQLRGLLTPGKEKLPPRLKHALRLLRLRGGFEGLENHVLGTEAFLKPWSYFRDSFLLVQPRNLQRASQSGEVKGMDILWFYTNFLEGELRYDPRADDTTSLFSVDTRKYGTFDNSHWSVQEHEKLLYAWLLQEFRVGKARNPFGFRYFELRNVCTAWAEVFVPIIDAVRASYDVRGRRYYGRLAAFIEERCPSRLAFPEGNVPDPSSAIPFHMISFPRQRDKTELPQPSPEPRIARPLTNHEYLEVEKDLRRVFGRRGRLLDMPKFKTRMQDWLLFQKTRAEQKKLQKDQQQREGKESPMFGCRGINLTSSLSSLRSVSVRSLSGRQSPESPNFQRPSTPTKTRDKRGRFTDNSYTAVVNSARGGHRGSRHCTSRQVELPETPPETSEVILGLKELVMERREAEKNKENDQESSSILPSPGPNRSDSDSVFSSIRNSNPFVLDQPQMLQSPPQGDEVRKSQDDVLSPMLPPSAVPKPLFNKPEWPLINVVKEADARRSSYEGTGYKREITPTFIAHNLRTGLGYDPSEGSSRGTLVPRVPTPVPQGQHQAALSSHARAYDPPQPVPWPGQYSPNPVEQCPQTPDKHLPAPFTPQAANKRSPAPELEDDATRAPPIPPKHPARYTPSSSSASLRRSATQDVRLSPPPRLPTPGLRIVSKKNIRAHLGNTLSRQIYDEDLEDLAKMPTGAVSGLSASPVAMPPPMSLRAYNSHMFPRQERKGTPVGPWMKNVKPGPGAEFEMNMMSGGKESK